MIDLSSAKKFRTQVDLNRLDICLHATLEKLGYAQDEAVTLKLTDNRAIHKLNKTYRNVDAPTDVLSFENDYLDPESGLHYLGDIVISIEKAQEQAANNEHPLQQEVEMLFVHGVLHLCGYEHAEEDEYAEMSCLQDEILKEVNNPLLGSISPPA
ncbi:MAG TPA: rRNA maturation RNase YbeY [Anaerolineaceae bacterium]|nr:MAG: Endoribonuclease YbeY [Anaerolineae bacterium 49_20]HAE86049.1 rRNA maturation RNase YbeY [Anaerolineaceae bacterium]